MRGNYSLKLIILRLSMNRDYSLSAQNQIFCIFVQSVLGNSLFCIKNKSIHVLLKKT